jgi:hypothetical protein
MLSGRTPFPNEPKGCNLWAAAAPLDVIADEILEDLCAAPLSGMNHDHRDQAS